MIDHQRQVDELKGQHEDLEHAMKQEHGHLRIAKAHVESLVKVMTSILEHIVTKCQIHINADGGRSRSQNLSQISGD